MRRNMKRLNRMENFELMLGKMIMNLLGGILGTVIILGVFWCIGQLMNWVEQSTFRTITYFVVGGVVIIKLILQEFKD